MTNLRGSRERDLTRGATWLLGLFLFMMLFAAAKGVAAQSLATDEERLEAYAAARSALEAEIFDRVPAGALVTADQTAVRVLPEPDAEIIGTVRRGSVLEAVDRNDDWFLVIYQGRTLYVSAEDVDGPSASEIREVVDSWPQWSEAYIETVTRKELGKALGKRSLLSLGFGVAVVGYSQFGEFEEDWESLMWAGVGLLGIGSGTVMGIIAMGRIASANGALSDLGPPPSAGVAVPTLGLRGDIWFDPMTKGVALLGTWQP